MATEIERKFLVDLVSWEALTKPKPIHCSQSYLLNEEGKNVRIRVMDDIGYLTIKSKKTSISRKEYEYQIPYDDALELLKLCEDKPVEKNRYLINFNGNTWEVDVFHGSNQGLIIAEIELKSEDQPFTKPPWVGEEVSENPKYYNARLLKHPFSEW